MDGRTAVAVDAVQVAGGVVLVATLFAPWTARGAGSAISGREVGDLLVSGTLDAVVPRAAAGVLYLAPVAGVLLLFAAATARARVRHRLEVAALAAVAPVVAVAAGVARSDQGGGAACVMVLAGAAAALVAVVARPRPNRHGTGR